MASISPTRANTYEVNASCPLSKAAHGPRRRERSRLSSQTTTLLMFVALTRLAVQAVMTDSNIRDAVNDWCEDPSAAQTAYGEISDWDTSRVTNMSKLFCETSDYPCYATSCVAFEFNEDISKWDVSNVKNMSNMFWSSTKFNQDIGNWNVAKVTDMSQMFSYATDFNQDIRAWNVANVADMAGMFKRADRFDQDISDWSTSRVTNMSDMFNEAGSFGQVLSWNTASVQKCDGILEDTRTGSYIVSTEEVGGFANGNLHMAACMWVHDKTESESRLGHISEWNTSHVTDMSNLFTRAKEFNEDIGDWDVSEVTSMSEMFLDASEFNEDIGEWNVSKVEDMAGMFYKASEFNVYIGEWDVGKVKDMASMFYEAGKFNADIGEWDVGEVNDMSHMFNQASEFNQNINKWDVSEVKTMDSMFYSANKFNQDISQWDVSGVANFDYMFFSATNFDQHLCWDILPAASTERMFESSRGGTASLESCNPTTYPTPPATFSPTSSPSANPTASPSTRPSSLPSLSPSSMPTAFPSGPPSFIPTHDPTTQPSKLPSALPTGLPSAEPTPQPSHLPSALPTGLPSAEPTLSHLPSAVPTGLPSAQPTPQPSHLPSAAPTPSPTFAPTIAMSKLENQHYVLIAISTFGVFLLTLFVRLDMKDYQKEKIGFMNTFVVTFAWLDFVGDLTWTWQRLYAYWVRDESVINYYFGLASGCSLALAFFVMSYNVFFRILLRHKKNLHVEKISSYSFVTLLFVACSDPEVIMFFPWKEESYGKMKIISEFPNNDCVRVTLLKLLEDIPEFIIQVAFFTTGNYDLFTFFNLLFTVVMLFYFVASKSLLLLMDPGDDEGSLPTGRQQSVGSVLMGRRQSSWTSVAPIMSTTPKVERRNTFKFSKERPVQEIMQDMNLVLDEYWGSRYKLSSKRTENVKVLAALQEELCVENWEKLEFHQQLVCVAKELDVHTNADTSKVTTLVEQGARRYRPYHLVKHELLACARESEFIKVDLSPDRKWSEVLQDLIENCPRAEWDSMNSKKKTYHIAHDLFGIEVKTQPDVASV